MLDFSSGSPAASTEADSNFEFESPWSVKAATKLCEDRCEESANKHTHTHNPPSRSARPPGAGASRSHGYTYTTDRGAATLHGARGTGRAAGRQAQGHGGPLLSPSPRGVSIRS